MRIGILYILFYITTQLFITNAHGQTVSVPDPGLRTCLLERHPATLDASQNLILDEAAKVTEPLICIGQGIKNAEGIQYFINTPEINLENNELSYIPQISGLSNLTKLELNDNQLVTLPEITDLTSLALLDVRRNNLKNLPDLSANTSLTNIIAHTNELDSLPELSSLTNLVYLNVAINNLTSLPNLDNLTSLRELKCWRNNLTSLPSLQQLNNLVYLEASTNKISYFPKFSPDSKIETIYLERNLIDTIPDLSILKSLTKARIYNNKLTFEDLVPLTTIPNYETIFPVTPQKKVFTGKTFEVLEYEDLALQTGIDNSLEKVVYEWIYNGKSVQKNEKDNLFAVTTSTTNSGYYYCKITHPDFPDLVLETDSFYVNVLPCINTLGFSTTVYASTCLKAGSVKINSFNQPFSNLSYELESSFSGKIFKSENGEFFDLNEPEYFLTVKAGEKCIKQIPKTIEIPIQPCEDVFITPNGDGVDDNYFFTQKGKATISDKWGNTVKTLDIPGSWNGDGISGVVSPGLYIIKINDGEEVIKMSVVY